MSGATATQPARSFQNGVMETDKYIVSLKAQSGNTELATITIFQKKEKGLIIRTDRKRIATMDIKGSTVTYDGFGTLPAFSFEFSGITNGSFGSRIAWRQSLLQLIEATISEIDVQFAKANEAREKVGAYQPIILVDVHQAGVTMMSLDPEIYIPLERQPYMRERTKLVEFMKEIRKPPLRMSSAMGKEEETADPQPVAEPRGIEHR